VEQPDILTMAKGITNGTVPMAATFVSAKIYDAFMTGPESAVELFHGYTYSAHPLAVAAGLATLDTYAEEGLLTRAAELASYWQDAIHALKGLPHVIDIRNFGLVGAIELESRADGPGKRAYAAFVAAYEKGLLTRMAGDVLVFAPPLIISKAEIDRLFGIVGDVLKTLD
jgi:beta-alanine--pyruvate transaminase